jgi:hypothetical protein
VDISEKRKVFCPIADSNLDHPVFSLVTLLTMLSRLQSTVGYSRMNVTGSRTSFIIASVCSSMY